jgi:hypothetical protein
MQMDNRMRKIVFQLGASYELAGRKLSDDTLLGAAKEVYDTIDVREDEVDALFRKARVIADVPTIRVLNEAYKQLCKERPIKNALPPPDSERLSKEEWDDMCKQIAGALKGV